MHAIVVPDPALGLDRCGLPVSVARSLFALPLRLSRRPLASLVGLRPVVVSHPESLDRHGTQAFFPSLVGDEALHLSPGAMLRLGLAPGDRVILRAPLSDEAREEACQRMMTPASALAPEDGLPRLTLSPDAALGLAYLTRLEEGARGAVALPADPHAPPPTGLGLPTLDHLPPWQRWEHRSAWSIFQAAISSPDELRPSIDLGIARLSAWQLAQRGHLAGFFASFDEVRRALDAGELSLHARIIARHERRHEVTTAGRWMVAQAAAGSLFSLCNRAHSGRSLASVLLACARERGTAEAIRLLARLEALGLDQATRAGLSLGIDSFAAPADKPALLRRAFAEIASVVEQYDEGLIVDAERYNKLVDIWAATADQMNEESKRSGRPAPGEPLRPVHMAHFMVNAGVKCDEYQLGRIAAMRGLVSRASGDIFEHPVLASWREGLPPISYFQTTLQSRRRSVEAPGIARMARSALDILARALGDTRVVMHDCGGSGALPVRLLDTGDPQSPPEAGLVGRALGSSLGWTGDGEHGDLLVGDSWRRLADQHHAVVPIRSLVTCEAPGGVCAVCHGQGPGLKGWPAVGDPVGLWAAHTIAALVPSMHVRWFHTSSGDEYSFFPSLERSASVAREGGVMLLLAGSSPLSPDLAGGWLAPREGGGLVVMNRGVDLVVVDQDGNESQRETLPRGAVLNVSPGEAVTRGQTLAWWDPSSEPLPAGGDGVARLRDLVPGHTYEDKVHEMLGIIHRVVRLDGAGVLRPRVEIERDGQIFHTHLLDEGARLRVREGEPVVRGGTLADTPRLLGDTVEVDPGDGRGSLFRLLSAHRSRSPGLLSEIDGVVSFEEIELVSYRRGISLPRPRIIVVTPRGPDRALLPEQARRYEAPRDGFIEVRAGDHVLAGNPLVMGQIDAGQLLRVFGFQRTASFLVERTQRICELSGQRLAPQHAELIVRELLGFVQITAPGEGGPGVGAVVPRAWFFRCNEALEAAGQRPARAAPVVVGLPRAPSLRRRALTAPGRRSPC